VALSHSSLSTPKKRILTGILGQNGKIGGQKEAAMVGAGGGVRC